MLESTEAPTEIRGGACLAALARLQANPELKLRVEEIVAREDEPHVRDALEAAIREDDEELERALTASVTAKR